MHHKSRSYDVWSFFVIMGHFFVLWPSKKSKLWKNGHMTEFFVILGHFLPFYPLNSPKSENIRKMKKNISYHMNRSSFYTSVPKIMIIGFAVPEIWHMIHVIFTFHFGLFLFFYPLTAQKNQNFKKMKTKCQEIPLFYTGVPKIMIRWCKVLRYGVQQRDEPMEKVTEVGVPPKNFILITFVCLKIQKLKLKKSSRFWNFWHYYFKIHFFPSRNHLAFLTIERHDIELPNIKISDKNFVPLVLKGIIFTVILKCC